MVATMDKPRRKIKKSLVLLEMSSSLNKFSDPRARYSTKVSTKVLGSHYGAREGFLFLDLIF